MRFVRVMMHRFFSVFRQSRADADLEREIELHIDQLTKEGIASGLSESEARKRALREFGPIGKSKEECRDARRVNLVGDLLKDLRHGTRMLQKEPGFTVVAILILGLGIGANTTIFSAVNVLLIQPLPYEHASELVVPTTVLKKYNTDRANLAYADYLDLKRQTQLFQAVAVHFEQPADVTGQDYPERIKTSLVSEDYFRVMEREPRLGRVFTPGESVSTKPDVVVLSYEYWMRRFGGDPSVLNGTLEISGKSERIVGVTAPHSTWPDTTDVFLPLGLGETPPAGVLKRDNFSIGGIARLRTGVTLAQAQSEVTVLARRIESEYPTVRAGTGLKLSTLSSWIIGPQMRQMLVAMMAAVALVLAIACANLANLLLVKGVGRGREFAVRLALGAGWPRLTRQVITEQAIVGGIGAIAGALIGVAGVYVLVHFAPADTPRLNEIRPDSTAYLFTALLSILTTVVVAIIPALQAARSNPNDALRDGGRSLSGGVRGSRLRALLVVSEMALSMILLIGAGLLMQTFAKLTRINLGFQPQGLTTFELALPDSRYPTPQRTGEAVSRIEGAIRNVPGVISAAATSALPAGGGGFYLGKSFLAANSNRDPVPGAWDVISPAYFDALRGRILAGRAFSALDTATAPPVVILSSSLAQKLFPHENAVGKQVRTVRDESFDREVVGVVDDIPYFALVDTQSDVAYVPHGQQSWNTMEFIVRSRLDRGVLMSAIKAAVAGQDSRIALAEMKTMDDVLGKALGRPRFLMLLVSIFAGIAVLLEAIGVYGVLSYFVSERAREIAIRRAVGAQASSIVRLVAFRGMFLGICGVVLGTAVALAATRTLSGLLFGITAHDPVTFGFAAVVLLAVAFISSVVPVYRAVRVDPIETLRYE